MSDNRPDESSERKPEYHSDRQTRREMRHEMRAQDPLRGLFPGLLLIVLGILLFAVTRDWISWDIWWKYFLIGLGVVFLIDAGAHYLNPGFRDTAFGRVIPGIVLLFIGIAFIYGFEQWWPLALIAAGIVILLSFVFRRKK